MTKYYVIGSKNMANFAKSLLLILLHKTVQITLLAGITFFLVITLLVATWDLKAWKSAKFYLDIFTKKIEIMCKTANCQMFLFLWWRICDAADLLLNKNS